MESHRPRGAVITTGEQGPSVLSTVARCVLVELDRDSIDTTLLTSAQEASLLYSHAMVGFLNYIATRWPNLQNELPREVAKHRKEFHELHAHSRVSGALATLLVGANLGFRFAQDVGALDKSAAEKHRLKCLNALLAVGKKQTEMTFSEKPSELFLGTLVTLIVQRKLHIDGKAAQFDIGGYPDSSDNAERIGWHDGTYIYLLSAALNCVKRFIRDGERSFSVSELDLRKELNNDGYLVRTQENELQSKARDPKDPKKSIRVTKLRIDDLELIASNMGMELPRPYRKSNDA